MQIPARADLYPAPQGHSEQVPIVVGSSGLTGRQQIVRDYDVEPDEDAPPPDGLALPTQCVRALQLPERLARAGERCPYDCPGRQESGDCLADLIRALPPETSWHCEVKLLDEWGTTVWSLVED